MISINFSQKSKRNLKARKDPQLIVLKDSIYEKTSVSPKPPKLFNETNAFVVDWQIPKPEHKTR